jgi:integrase
MVADPYRKVDLEIDRLNKGKLKSLPISLCRSGGSLYVQGTFPPKLGESIPKQRRVPLKLKADIDWLFEAKNRAIAIGSDLLLGKWEWDVENLSQIPPTIPELIEMHQARYLDRNGNSTDTLTYWKKDFLYPFNKLPVDMPLSIEICQSAIAAVPTNTRSRTRYLKAYRQLLTVAGIDPTCLEQQRSRSSAQKAKPREIPELGTIITSIDKLPSSWQFYYFLLACFGLRGTEAHPSNCSLDDLSTGELTVYSGKTKQWRYVPSCSQILFDALYREPSYSRLDRTPNQLSDDFCKVLRRSGAEFTPYDLRHAYAYITLLEGWDTALSARYMGHSILLHQQTYWHWIDKHKEREIRRVRQLSSPTPSPCHILDNSPASSDGTREPRS